MIWNTTVCHEHSSKNIEKKSSFEICLKVCHSCMARSHIPHLGKTKRLLWQFQIKDPGSNHLFQTSG